MDFSLSGVMTQTSTFTAILLYLLIVVWFVGMALAIWYLSGFKHRVRVRQLASDNRQIIIDDRARRFKDKDGVFKWRLLKVWQVVSIPPDESLDVGKRGQVMAEAFRTKDGSFIWIKSSFDLEKYKTDHPEFKPLTGEERSMQVRQLRAAKEYANNSLSQRLLELTPMFILVIVFFGFMIFFNEVVAPTIDLAHTLTTTAGELGTSTEAMKQVCLERLTLAPEAVAITPPN